MTQSEEARRYVLESVNAGDLRGSQAAEVLGVSERHVWRLLASYRARGAPALAHGNRGRRPHNVVPDSAAARVVRFARDHYPGANHTHLSELLWEHEGLALSRFTIRRILESAGMPSPRRRRPPEHRVRRERMPREGMLLQVDGSHHAWLEARGPRFTLLLAVDDATGDVPSALFRPAEDARGYFSLLERVVLRRGLPLALYTDRHGVFQAPPGRAGRRPPTQFSRALGELGITQVFARSPQAKGRVERFAGTLQDRLVTELRHAGTSTIAEAQEVLDGFLPGFNARFRVQPRQSEPAYRPLDPALDSIRRSTWVPSSPSAIPARSGGTTPSSTAGARSSCCPAPSGPATPGRGSMWLNEQTARSRFVTTASRSPRAWPRRRPGRCARPVPNWPAVPTTSASSRAAAPAARCPGLPRLPARATLRSSRRATEPLLIPQSTDARCSRPRLANSPAGRRSSRRNCKDCRCGRPLDCSGSRARP